MLHDWRIVRDGNDCRLNKVALGAWYGLATDQDLTSLLFNRLNTLSILPHGIFSM